MVVFEHINFEGNPVPPFWLPCSSTSALYNSNWQNSILKFPPSNICQLFHDPSHSSAPSLYFSCFTPHLNSMYLFLECSVVMQKEGSIFLWWANFFRKTGSIRTPKMVKGPKCSEDQHFSDRPTKHYKWRSLNVWWPWGQLIQYWRGWSWSIYMYMYLRL